MSEIGETAGSASASVSTKLLRRRYLDNLFSVCPVGALTDRTARFTSRVWFTKPMNASCKCDKCSGKATVYMKGDEIVRVTARKDQWGEVEEFICDTCRFERKNLSDWNIEGPRHIDRHSVISLNHYEKPKDELRVLDNPMAKEISEKDEK